MQEKLSVPRPDFFSFDGQHSHSPAIVGVGHQLTLASFSGELPWSTRVVLPTNAWEATLTLLESNPSPMAAME